MALGHETKREGLALAMSSEALNPQQFHGTRAELKPGDQLMGDTDMGKRNYPTPGGNRVFTTSDPHDAWQWGVGAHGENRPRAYAVHAPQAERTYQGGTEHNSPSRSVTISHELTDMPEDIAQDEKRAQFTKDVIKRHNAASEDRRQERLGSNVDANKYNESVYARVRNRRNY